MQLKIIAADSRGGADYGWLKTLYTYSFANYYDPQGMGFGKLRGWDDETVAPGKAFGHHRHDNMEIITSPLAGTLAHEDSTGNRATISAGEVQVMSVGTGIVHAEMNPSNTEAVQLFQIWLETRDWNILPEYSQKRFEITKNQLQLLVAPNQTKADVVKIHQDAWLHRGNLNAGQRVKYNCKDASKNGVFLMVISGSLQIENQTLSARDAAEISEAETIDINVTQDAQLLLIEVPLR